MKNILFGIAFAAAFATASIAGDFDLYIQVEQAKLDRATNEVAQAFIDGLTRDQWLQYADEYIATNSVLYQADGKPHGNIWQPLERSKGYPNSLGSMIYEIGRSRGRAAEFCDEYDQRFAAAGCPLPYTRFDMASYFPKSLSVWLGSNTNELSTKRVYIATSLARRERGVDDNRFGTFSNYTAPEIINRIANDMAIGCNSVSNIQKAIEYCGKSVVRPIRRKLRERGVSFVGQDGESNPVQAAIDDLVETFNAPKLEGLKEWVAEWFPEYRWIDVDDLFMSDEEMTKLCDDIYYGEKDLTGHHAVLILSHLGLDGYNAFVERYNGGD